MAPSVSRSPPRHLRTSGRPMGPATPYIQTQFSRTNCFGFVWFLLGLRLVSGCCSDFSGEIIRLFGFVPFRTCPLLAEVFVVLSLSFSLVVWLWSPTTFALFLSLSGAGETQTPFGVWVSPCVLFFADKHYAFDPYPVLRVFSKVKPSSPCLFFSRRSRGCLLGVVLAVLSVCLPVCLPVHAR